MKKKGFTAYEMGMSIGEAEKIDGILRNRTLEMGPNKGDLVAELVFSSLVITNLKSIYRRYISTKEVDISFQ